MNRIEFPLKPQMKRPAVGDLHAALGLLGYAILDAEQSVQRFGKSTRDAVRKLQTDHELAVTGVVDQATADLLNCLLAERSAVFVVDGPGTISELYQLGSLCGLAEARMAAVLAKAPHAAAINDDTLASLVATGDLQDSEAKELGLCASLYQLCDSNVRLAERLKKGNLAKLGPAPLTRMRDLAVLESADWLTLLQQAEVEPPDGMQREEYARVLAHKLAALYPTDAFLRRLPTIEPDRLRSDIEHLEPLFAANQALFTAPGWRPSFHAAWDTPEAQALLAEMAAPLRLADLAPELAQIDMLIQPVDPHPLPSTEPATLAESTAAQEAYTRLDYLCNLHPGLGLGDILDNPSLASIDKARCVAERIMLLQRVREQNEDVELLSLDYTRGSEDIAALKLDSLAEDERRGMLATLRAYRRAYALANDVDQARTMLGAGFHSALAIVNAGFDAFARGTGLSEPVAREYWNRARNMTIATGAGMGALLDGIRSGFDTFVSNLQSIQALDDYKELFGNQTYCDCKHCQSILSPAAYFVDLMHYLGQNWTAMGYLLLRRSDLYTLELTCDNTNTEIPTLDIVNDILETYIFARVCSLFHHFKLTTASFDELKRAGVPDAILTKLQPLKNHLYDNGLLFEQALRPHLEGMEQLIYGNSLLKAAFWPVMFTLSDASFELLRQAHVPEDSILKNLEALKNQKYHFKYLFLLALIGQIGQQGVKQFGSIIMQSALSPWNFADPDAIVESIVFQFLDDLSPYSTSFQRPCALSLEKLASYLALLDTTRAAIARALEADAALLARAVLNLSLPEYQLVTQAHADLTFLSGLYRIALAWESPDKQQFTPVDVQDVLRSTRLTRSELADLAQTRFVSGGLVIRAEKRDPRSVQNDLERIYHLTPGVLDRIHRFVRLWRRLPVSQDAREKPRWEIGELDLVLTTLAEHAPHDPDLTPALLEQLVGVLSLQERCKTSVVETCALWSSSLSDIRLACGPVTRSLLDQLFNMPSFGNKDTAFPRDADRFVHPSWLKPGEAVDSDDALHRLVAGLQVSVEELAQLIESLKDSLGFDPDAQHPQERGFYLTAHNITLLYRHAQLGRRLGLPAPQLFQFIELAIAAHAIDHGNAADANSLNLADLGTVIEFYDWWKASRYTLDDLGFITGKRVLDPSSYPDASQLTQRMLADPQTSTKLAFADSLFASLEGVTETMSQDIIAKNSHLFAPVNSEKRTYRLSGEFEPSTTLVIPDEIIGAVAAATNISTQDAADRLDKGTRQLLNAHHASQIIAAWLAALLKCSADKAAALCELTEAGLFAPEYMQILAEPGTDSEPLKKLFASMLPLSVLFGSPDFDAATLAFVKAHGQRIFAVDSWEAITPAHVQALSVYRAVAEAIQAEAAETDKPGQPGFSAISQVLLELANWNPGAPGDPSALASGLAALLNIQASSIASLLNSIALPASAPQRLQKIICWARLGRHLGLGGESLKLIISNDADELALAEGAVLGALRLAYPNDKNWQAKMEPVEDDLRSSRRDILVDFMLQLSQLGMAGFAELKDEKALYDFFLIDVELGGCARTSRLVAAISSVQLYIQRLLMNLERIALSNNATTAAQMTQEWEWRKNYRVWEANRKVFLYPENYIEPDLRDDKTPLFRELEDTLLQQEINQQHVLDAYAAYLNGFEQVARLKIAGSYHDIREQGDILHLFGVTQDNPPVYYYRPVKNAIHAEVDPDAYGIDWSYWRKVDVQIPVARVAPIVYQGRLYVFWVEITTTPKNDVTGGQSTFVGYKHKMSLKYTSLRLDGTWTAPQPLSIKDSDLFPTGEGIIDDPLFDSYEKAQFNKLITEVTTAIQNPVNLRNIQAAFDKLLFYRKEMFTPRYDQDAHIEGGSKSFVRRTGESDAEYRDRISDLKPEPRDGYTLTGFQWDQVYPGITNADGNEGELVVTGRNYAMRSAIDFYRRNIVAKPKETANSLGNASIPSLRILNKHFNLIPMPDGKLLDWNPATGDWRLWKYSATSTLDILPGKPVAQGSWSSIRTGHTLIPMEDGRVLDWMPATGAWKLWNYDPASTLDILPGMPVAQGCWSSIRAGHTLIPLYNGTVLDWHQGTGTWRQWNYDPTQSDILPGAQPVASGFCTQLVSLPIIGMPDGKLLDCNTATHTWRLWNFIPTPPIPTNPYPGALLASGTSDSVRAGHTLVPMPDGALLDWVAATGDWQLWKVDPNTGNLFGTRIAQGQWGQWEGLALEGYTTVEYIRVQSPLDDYATCSICARPEHLVVVNELADQGTLNIQISDPISIGCLEAAAEIAPINGSATDCIVDVQGDLFVIQGSVRNSPNHLLKRLGTGMSEMLVRTLFASGLDAMLAIQLDQARFHENPHPFMAVSGRLQPDEVTERNADGSRTFDVSHGPYGVYYRELFFHIPFLIANHLHSQGRFADAQHWYHYIFNPTAREVTDPPQDRNWRYLEFRGAIPSLRQILQDAETIQVYKQDPFNPHAIARLRPSAYQKNIVMKYLDNLLDWADTLFSQYTMESVNEATLLYVMAAEILGERPPELGECGEGGLHPRNYATIAPLLQQGEFLQEFEMTENLALQALRSGVGKQTIRYTYALDPLDVASVSRSTGSLSTRARHASTDGNAIFQAYEWKKMTIGSGERQYGVQDSPLIQDSRHLPDFSASLIRSVVCRAVDLAHEYTPTLQSRPLFCIPANTDLLGYWDRVEDRLLKIHNCLDLNGVRRKLDLFAPEINPKLLVQMKAAGLTLDDVLAGAGAGLPPYRFTYLVEKAKQFAGAVQGFGAALLSAIEKKDVEQLNKLRTVHERNILQLTRQAKQWEIDAEAETIQSLERQQELLTFRKDFYQGLLDQGLSSWERTEEVARHATTGFRITAATLGDLAAIIYLLPQLGSPFSMKYGGLELGNSGKSWSEAFNIIAGISDSIAASAGLEATFERRAQEWKYQLGLAVRELKQIERQLVAARIRQKIANRSLEIHEQSIEQAKEVYEYYADKFSNYGLYTWLSTTMQAIHREAYNSALAMARLAEMAYHFERGDDSTVLLEPGYWEASRAGMLAGERLLLALQNIERRFIETNYRTFEIDQSFSLAQIDPAALMRLRTTGTCDFEIPELYFDLLYPGQYQRLIKSVRLTIPCVTGPYTNIGATLRLTGSQIRMEAKTGEILKQVPLQRAVCIATSKGQNDSGVFELNFHDERYMPFEGAGAISNWQLKLPNVLRSFDYDTISDVILHISYTARDGGDFRTSVEEGIVDAVGSRSLYRLLSLKHEFPNTFYQVLNPTGTTASPQFELGQQHFPYFVSEKDLSLSTVTVCLKPTGTSPVPTTGLTLSLGPSQAGSGNASIRNWTMQKFGKMAYGTASISGDPRGKWTLIPAGCALDEALADILILFEYTITS